MLIDEMTQELWSGLQAVWSANAERLPDHLRDPSWVDLLLFNDGGETQFRVVDGTSAVVIVSDVTPGLSATVMVLNHDQAEVGDLVRELRSVIEENDLRRLTAQVPAPVKDLQQALRAVGFRREGHMRRATRWSGRLVGLDLYGLYRDPPRERGRSGNGKAKD